MSGEGPYWHTRDYLPEIQSVLYGHRNSDNAERPPDSADEAQRGKYDNRKMQSEHAGN